jgi:hypothetical protein
LGALPTFQTQVNAAGTYVDGAISEAVAALVAANLPSLTGRALDAVRVNAAANGVEFANVTAAGWALLDDANAAPLYACRAWVNFYGADPVAILASGNVSSITDNGTGDYTVNFATALPGVNYCAVVTAGGNGTLASGNALVGWAAIYASGSVRIGVSDNNSDVNNDAPYCNVAIFR